MVHATIQFIWVYSVDSPITLFFSLEIPLILPSVGNIIKTQAFTATPTKQASRYLIDDACYSPHTEGKVQTKTNYSPSDFFIYFIKHKNEKSIAECPTCSFPYNKSECWPGL